MFILSKINDRECSYLLQEGAVYLVGRKDSDIILDDPTVSRKHAKITVKDGTVNIEDLNSPNQTRVNSDPLKPNTEVQLRVGFDVRFGTRNSIFTLQIDEIEVTTSCVSSADKAELRKVVLEMGGRFTDKWNAQATHIVADELVLTAKVLNAIICRQKVVTSAYFKDRWQSAQSKKALPRTENYRPKIPKGQLQMSDEIDWNCDRTGLFRNKLFVFATVNEEKKMREFIRLAGGKSLGFDANPIPKKNLLNADCEHIFIVTDKQTQSEDSAFDKCVKHLQANGRRAIAMLEITLSVIQNNCAKNCNSLFDKVKHLTSGEKVTLDKHSTLVPASETPNSYDVGSSKEVINATFDNDFDIVPVPKKRAAEELSNKSKKSKFIEDDVILIEDDINNTNESTSGQGSSTDLVQTQVTNNNKRKSENSPDSKNKKSNNRSILSLSNTAFEEPSCSTENSFKTPLLIFSQNTPLSDVDNPFKTKNSKNMKTQQDDKNPFKKLTVIGSQFPSTSDNPFKTKPDSATRKSKRTHSQDTSELPFQNQRSQEHTTQKQEENPFKSMKFDTSVRKQSEKLTNPFALPKSLKLENEESVVNPFTAKTRQSNNSTSAIASGENPFALKSGTNAKSEDLTAVNSENSESTQIGSVDIAEYETKPNIQTQYPDDLPDDIKKYISSMKTKEIITKMCLRIATTSLNNTTLNTSTRTNFKRFKNASVPHIQTTIVPMSSYKRTPFTSPMYAEDFEDEEDKPEDSLIKENAPKKEVKKGFSFKVS